MKQKKAIQDGFVEHSRAAGKEQTAAAAGREILERLLADYDGPVAIRLWSGECINGNTTAPCTVVVHDPSVLRHLVLHRDLLHLAECYLAGELDAEGDMEQLFDLIEYASSKLHLSGMDKWRMLQQAFRLPRRRITAGLGVPEAPRHNSKESIAYHYDVSNDFYRLWLDPEMVYSCAYFRDTEQSLAEAQRDKLDYICRKLRLEPGQKLLDIGCGWGALAIWAARHYGVQAYGITLSEQQYRHASERVEREGLADEVTIELRDYRELEGEACYDRIVSVGMFEHIGVANFPLYFGTVKRLLKPGGLFLNHGITNDTGWQDTPITRFMNRYVFPDGELERISKVQEAMEDAGFEILDVESLRRHYTLTLRSWVRALEAHREQAVATAGDATYRLWRLYMAGCAYYFNEGSTNIYQVLAAPACQPLTIPLRRDDLYRRSAVDG